MLKKFVVIAAWGSIAVLAYATLAHVDFVYSIYYKLAPLLKRPEMRTYVHFEHVIAFAIFGALFSLAYPRSLVFVCTVVLISAGALEYLQTLTPDRHGTLIDACEKIVGGALGVFAARAAFFLWRRKRVSQSQPLNSDQG
jgi:VanZ family protein